MLAIRSGLSSLSEWLKSAILQFFLLSPVRPINFVLHLLLGLALLVKSLVNFAVNVKLLNLTVFEEGVRTLEMKWRFLLLCRILSPVILLNCLVGDQ